MGNEAGGNERIGTGKASWTQCDVDTSSSVCQSSSTKLSMHASYDLYIIWHVNTLQTYAEEWQFWYNRKCSCTHFCQGRCRRVWSMGLLTFDHVLRAQVHALRRARDIREAACMHLQVPKTLSQEVFPRPFPKTLSQSSVLLPCQSWHNTVMCMLTDIKCIFLHHAKMPTQGPRPMPSA